MALTLHHGSFDQCQDAVEVLGGEARRKHRLSCRSGISGIAGTYTERYTWYEIRYELLQICRTLYSTLSELRHQIDQSTSLRSSSVLCILNDISYIVCRISYIVYHIIHLSHIPYTIYYTYPQLHCFFVSSWQIAVGPIKCAKWPIPDSIYFPT